jgi:hypothetical protein
MTPYSLVILHIAFILMVDVDQIEPYVGYGRCFLRTVCLLGLFFDMKMEAVHSSETSMKFYHTRLRYVSPKRGSFPRKLATNIT